MPVNWGIQQFQPNTKLDLSPLTNQLNFNRQQKRQDSLADLTRTTAEKEEAKAAEISKIFQGSQGNLQTAHQQLVSRGFMKEALDVQKYAQSQIKAKQDEQTAQMELQKNQNERLSSLSLSVGNSKNPAQAFKKWQNTVINEKLPVNENLLRYQITDEDTDLDPNVIAELNWMATSNQTGGGKTEYGLKPIPILKNGVVELWQPKKTGGAEKMDFGEGVEALNPDYKYVNAGNEYIVKDQFNREVGRMPKGIDPGKAKDIQLKGEDLELKKAKAAQDEELFQAKKVEIAKKTRAYNQKNKGQLASIQTFLDRAQSVLKSKDMGKTSGASRYLPGGSEIPVFETKGKDLQADIDFLVSMSVIETMTKLKSESPTGSTGFGALSEKELQVMQNAFSLLGNPNLSANKKRDEVKKVIDIMETRAREQRAFDSINEQLLGPELPAEQQKENDIRSLLKRQRD